MNKLTIPAILAATVMVAGIFAFMPVEQASTVHTTVQGTQTVIAEITAAQVDGTVLDGGATTTLTCGGPCIILGIHADFATDDDADEELNIAANSITLDGVARDHGILDLGNFAYDHELLNELFAGEHSQLAAQGAATIPWLDIGATALDAGDTLDVVFIVLISSGDVAGSSAATA